MHISTPLSTAFVKKPLFLGLSIIHTIDVFYILLQKTTFDSVRIGRIELPPRPWQGRVLPLNNIRSLS